MGEGQNDVSYSNPEVDKPSRPSRDLQPGGAQQNLRRIHELVAEDQPHTYCFMGSQMVAVRNRFQNVRVSRAGYGLFTWYPSLTQWWVPKEMQK